MRYVAHLLAFASLLLPLQAAGCGDDDTRAGTDGGVTVPGTDGATPLPDGAMPLPDGAAPGVDGGPTEPTTTSACNGDRTCGAGETCASCAADCGSCDVEDLAMQRAKYVDETCLAMGDGLADECATSAGGAGRFNALQAALDSLEAGDTLYVYPGDYFREVTVRDSGGLYTLEADGTAERPIVVTARFRDRAPTIHSCDPADPMRCPGPALAAYGDHAILDHLRVRGRVQVWGATGGVMQYLECTHGWGACGDGNWSCLRIESCTDCVAHHNYVHDVSGADMGEACYPDPPADFQDRGACFKEFQSTNTIWELNTCERSPYWAYDLHRNSVNTTLRFNDFRGFPGSAIRAQRTKDLFVYGNVMVAGDGGGGCVNIWGRNERVEAEPHVVEVHHNTCAGAQTGVAVTGELPSEVHDNVVAGLREVSERPRNVVIESAESALSHNAYDTNGNYRRQEYEPDTWSDDLAAWQADNGWDEESVEADGGPCGFVMAPSEGGAAYDVHLGGGACTTLARDGGEVGAYGVTTCVGHTCP